MDPISRIGNRLKDIGFIPPLDRLWVRGMRGRVTCFLYHRVADPAADEFLARGGSPAIRPAQLARELGFLRRIGARFATFGDLRAGWFPANSEIGVIISFDDGFRSNYEQGLDVLGSLGIRAVFFQVTGLVDARVLLWEHALYWHTRDEEAAGRLLAAVREARPDLARGASTGRQLAIRLRERVSSPEVERLLRAARVSGEPEIAARLYPTAAMLREARDRGHEIGSHGHGHYKRDTVDEATFETDLARSAHELERLLGEPPAAFSYPFNSHRPGDDAIVGRHFQQAITVDRRRIERGADPYRLSRFNWPGHPRSGLRHRRWLLTGRV